MFVFAFIVLLVLYESQMLVKLDVFREVYDFRRCINLRVVVIISSKFTG